MAKNNQKSYTQKNDDILQKWKERFLSDGGDVDKFSYDGILYMGEMELDPHNNNPNCYWREPSDDECSKENMMWTNCPVRFLFLTKDQDIRGGDAWDVRTETYCDAKSEEDNYFVWKKYSFNKRLAYIFRGLVSVVKGKFISFEDVIADQQACIKVFEEYPVARINCKKEGGDDRCPINILHKHMAEYREYLIQQIDNLDADVFICCEHHDENKAYFGNKVLGNIFIEFLNDNGYNFEWTESGINGIWIDKEKKKVAIDSYHLSYRGKGLSDQFFYDDIVNEFHEFYSANPNFFVKR